MNSKMRPWIAVTVVLLLASTVHGDEAASKEPSIGFNYDWRMHFGVVVLKDPRGKPIQKQLTFDTHGQTGSLIVKVDNKEVLFGTEENGGKMTVRGTEAENPSTCVWTVDSVIQVTQTLEIVPGKTGKLDTLLVRYEIENKDQKPHAVGMRLLIDSAIGDPENDGVPFRFAGGKELVTTFKDFQERDMPVWVEALEKPNDKNPGTITVMTLKAGGDVEAPSRASITAWMRSNMELWDIPLSTISPEGAGTRKDSSLVLYWMPKEMKPGEKRTPGYAYGTQDKPSDELPNERVNTGAGKTAGRGGSGAGKLATGADASGGDKSEGNDGEGDLSLKGDPKKRPDPNSQDAGKNFDSAKSKTNSKTSCCEAGLSAQHAQCAMKAALGIIPHELRLDQDSDGKATENDARLLLKQAIAKVRMP